MEQTNTQNDIFILPKSTTTLDPPPTTPHQKRKKDSVQAIRVALLKMGGCSPKSKVCDELKPNKIGIWRRLVGSMRPFHLLDNQSPSESPKHYYKSPLDYGIDEEFEEFQEEKEEEEEEEDDEKNSNYSPYPPSPNTLYASAVGLNELVQGDEESTSDHEDNFHVEEDETSNVVGDDMIDAKADEFIAQFYKEIRLQSWDSNVDTLYKKRSHRSLGF